MPAPAYRPDIDGLRAVAVVFVLIFHAFPSVLPGGFIGVDVFFVISGFLITGIIVRQLGAGSFTLSGFYFRRMRRIFPALIVVLLATMTLGWFFFLPNEFVSLGKNVLAGALFFPNLMLLSEVGYFDVAAQLKPLLHLWSLGIEEQYYLAFPLFLMCFWRRRFMVWGVVVIALGSFALSVLLTKSNPSAAFYLPFTRAWELMIGALIALVPRLVVNSNLRSTLGCVLIGAAAFLLDPKTPYPGWAALLPTLGAALLIAAEGSMLNRALALRPVVFVGLISYPLYLWHWPLLSFFGILDEQPSALARGGILLASAALAYLTYRYIETPVRRASDRFMFPKMAGFSGAMLAACMCGAFIVYTGGYPPRLSSQIASAGILNPSFDGLQKSACLVNSNATTEFPPECIDDDTSKPLVLLWGDSTAGALAPGFRNLQQRIPFRFGQLVTSSCWPIVGYDVAGVPNCRLMNDKALSIIKKRKPEVVILEGIWATAFEDIGRTVATIKALGVPRVTVLGRPPVWNLDLPTSFLKFHLLHGEPMPVRLHKSRVDSDWTDAVKAASRVGRWHVYFDLRHHLQH